MSYRSKVRTNYARRETNSNANTEPVGRDGCLVEGEYMKSLLCKLVGRANMVEYALIIALSLSLKAIL